MYANYFLMIASVDINSYSALFHHSNTTSAQILALARIVWKAELFSSLKGNGSANKHLHMLGGLLFLQIHI